MNRRFRRPALDAVGTEEGPRSRTGELLVDPAYGEGVVRDVFAGLYEGNEGIGLKVVGETYFRGRTAPRLAVHAGSGAATAEWDRALAPGPLDGITVWFEHGHVLHQEDPERFSGEVRRWRLPAGV